MTKAKRGDLAVLVITRRDYILREGVRERTEVQLCEVTNITREGLARKVRPANWGTTVDVKVMRADQVYIVPAAEFDVATALQRAAEHPWPGGQPGMPYASLDEAKAMLRPLKRAG
jgi:hypothetical protein